MTAAQISQEELRDALVRRAMEKRAPAPSGPAPLLEEQVRFRIEKLHRIDKFALWFVSLGALNDVVERLFAVDVVDTLTIRGWGTVFRLSVLVSLVYLAGVAATYRKWTWQVHSPDPDRPYSLLSILRGKAANPKRP